MNTININYTWNKDLAIKSAQDIYEYELKSSNKRFIGWLMIALVQFGVVGALKHGVYGFLTLGTIGAIYWYWFRWPLRKFFISKTFDKSPLANKEIALEAKEDGIYSNEQLQIDYNNISKYAKLDDAIIIYHSLGTIYIPNDAFENHKFKNKFIQKLETLLTKKS